MNKKELEQRLYRIALMMKRGDPPILVKLYKETKRKLDRIKK